MSKKIQIEQAPIARGSSYPSPYHEPCRERVRQRLGDSAGLTQFWVNLTRLSPGACTRLAREHTQVVYPDIDLRLAERRFLHQDGRPYPEPSA